MGYKKIELECDSCGASMEISTEGDIAYCSYCGKKILIKEERVHISKEDAEEIGYYAGYAFEKGRMQLKNEINERRRAIQNKVPPSGLRKKRKF